MNWDEFVAEHEDILRERGYDCDPKLMAELRRNRDKFEKQFNSVFAPSKKVVTTD